MSTIALQRRASARLATRGSRAAAQPRIRQRRQAMWRRVVERLGDGFFLLLAILAVPAAILVVGTPIALVLGVAVEMGQGEFLGLLTKAIPALLIVSSVLFLARFLARDNAYTGMQRRS